MPKHLKVYFDGGCRPNPGAMEIAVVIAGVVHVSRDIGPGTSMEAEWLALIQAQQLAVASGAPRIVLLGDSRSVIDQAMGRVRCTSASRHHLDRFQAMLPDGATPHIRAIKRNQNLAGIALARLHGR